MATTDNAYPWPISISAEGAAGWAVLLLLVLCVSRANSCRSGCCGSCKQDMNLSQGGYDFVASQAVDQCGLQAAIAAVNELVTACLTQDQFDALVDFAYDIGPQEFARSRVLALVNACDYDGVAQALAYAGFRPIACYFSQKPAGYTPVGCPAGTGTQISCSQ